MHNIQMEKVTFIRNNRKILNDITIQFPPGKTSVIIGPSGCGKSTLLKVAAGLIPPTSGKVYINGKNLLTMNHKQLQEFRMQSGFVFQDAALWANKSVYENINLPLKVHSPDMNPDERKTRILAILKKVGYTDSIHLLPAQLSNGERKMVSLARALVVYPSLVYLDNPLILVDPSVSAKMQKLILDLHKGEETILANFSSTALTKRMSDYIAVMKDGMVIATGTMEEIDHCQNQDAREIIESLLTRDYNNSV